MTPTELHITIDGHPGAQGSKRSYGPGRMVESSKKVAPWRTDVRDAATTAATATGWTTATGPVTATITFRFARPKAHYRTGRNDQLHEKPKRGFRVFPFLARRSRGLPSIRGSFLVALHQRVLPLYGERSAPFHHGFLSKQNCDGFRLR